MPKLLEGSFVSKQASGFSDEEIKQIIDKAVETIKGKVKKILLVPPDFTRLHSQAGVISRLIYLQLKDTVQVDVLPALGTHVKMTEQDWNTMYSPIPYQNMLVHDWRKAIVKIGEVPSSFVKEVSEGIMEISVPVEINRALLDKSYDLILSIGQVVPHEVVGMANQSKNLFVGVGGAGMINTSHMLGAFYGMERMMGRDHSPVRKVLDYASEHFIKDIPLQYILTVTDAPEGNIRTHGLFIGRDRKYFEDAVKLSQEKNIIKLDKPIKKAIVLLDGKEFHSTWLGNKSVYRTRMAIADGGELLVLAPGVKRFGEDEQVDMLIRKYGYRGRDYVLEQTKQNEDLRGNMSAAAHLIHGSSDGRFKITYCTQHLTKEEVEQVGYGYMPLQEAVEKYDTENLKPGYNTVNGEEIYYIDNPALGLWMA
ncbi:MAG: lactate racemase domain-containing protein [Eubacteriales bacterium]|nr:lactate racemase domain-containing protein [Eubacteriales bacterium]